MKEKPKCDCGGAAVDWPIESHSDSCKWKQWVLDPTPEFDGELDLSELFDEEEEVTLPMAGVDPTAKSMSWYDAFLNWFSTRR